ncbi:MAG: bacterioferritin [Rhodospirillales bacterium]
MAKEDISKPAVIQVLNKILEAEIAGVVRYTHYSFMVYGFGRIPIVSWLRSQADEGLLHAQQAGELVTALGGHPSLGIGKLLESQKHDIAAILEESLVHERAALDLYGELLALVEGRDVMLEEYARRMISEEAQHMSEVDKMLRQPGDLRPFSA